MFSNYDYDIFQMLSTENAGEWSLQNREWREAVINLRIEMI
jgi:hypothetical protein